MSQLPMMREWKWKFRVRGSLTRGVGGDTIPAYNSIVESGVRSRASPHALVGVGPIAHPDHDGRFRTWYLTRGTDGQVEIPASMSIFVNVARGKWKLFVVSVAGRSAKRLSKSELLIDLGAGAIDREETLYVSGTG